MIITLDELKRRLNINTNEHDQLLTEIINYNTEVLNAYCNRSFDGLVSTTDKFIFQLPNTILICKSAPITDVKILYNNEDLDPDKYIIDEQNGIIYLLFTPELNSVIQIDYKYGYVTAPPGIKEILLKLCVSVWNKVSSEGIDSIGIGDFKVSFRDFLRTRYSTEIDVYLQALDRYKL